MDKDIVKEIRSLGTKKFLMFKNKMTNYVYQHKYCSFLGCEVYCDQDKTDYNEDSELNNCPRTYEEFITTIKEFMDFEPELECVGNYTHRERANHYIEVADVIDDLKKAMESIIKQRITDGLDVKKGQEALKDISRV